jgi:hypothetical protein
MIPPEDEQHQLIFLRMMSLLAMYFLFLLIVCSFITMEVSSWPPPEFGIRIPRDVDFSGSIIIPLSPVVIAKDGTVTFDSLTCLRSDRDLDSLRIRLAEEAIHTSKGHPPLEVHPDPDSRHERLMEVLSTVERSGIRRYLLK